MRGPQFDPGSFRDPAARVFRYNGGLFRYLSADALRDWEQLASTRFFRQFSDTGRLIGTTRLVDPPPFTDLSSSWVAVLKHERVQMLSFPYEWCFGMLQDAALLQLDLLLAALDEGMTMKDATPFNVQWLGTRPTFIDVGSFTHEHPGEAWAGYRQFCQLFLYPLFLQAYKNLPFHPWLRGSLEGIDARHCVKMMSLRDLLRPGVLAHVYLMSKMQARYEGGSRNIQRDLRAAGFSATLVKNNVNRLRRLVARLRWTPGESAWSAYTQSNTYEEKDRETKRRFVSSVAATQRWPCVWDIGCNTGEYSRLVAAHADRVVALDADHPTIERFYHALKTDGNSAILPLVSDVADPSPALGWRSLERPGLGDRAKPDLILCLALVHHLAIGRNIPLPELVDWLAGFGAHLVIEFVDADDPMVQRLLLNRGAVDFSYSRPQFESCLGRSFRVLQSTPLSLGTRVLYHASPR